MTIDDQNKELTGSVQIRFADHLNWIIASRAGLKLGLIIGVAFVGWTLCEVIVDPLRNISHVNWWGAAATIAGFPIFIFLFSIVLWLIFHILTSKDQRAVNWAVNEKTLTMTDANGMACAFPWTQVKRVKRCRTGLLIYMKKPSGIRWIPSRTFDEASIQAILNLAKSA